MHLITGGSSSVKIMREYNICIKCKKNRNIYYIKIIWNHLMEEIEDFAYSPSLKKDGIVGYEYLRALGNFEKLR